MLLSFLAINEDHASRDRVWQGKYFWKTWGRIEAIGQIMREASSARCVALDKCNLKSCFKLEKI